jgi:hypothetical protein
MTETLRGGPTWKRESRDLTTIARSPIASTIVRNKHLITDSLAC